MKKGEESIFVDLIERGIRLIPSATSQLASRSKVFQTRLFADLMIPQTRAIYNLHDLLEAICAFEKSKINQVVVKHDRKNGGLGILRYRNIEDVYTQAVNKVLAFPFVVQPFMKNAGDIRVIIVGDFFEAYRRSNLTNFRNNLHWGGESERCHLDNSQSKLCKTILTRGSFPYGHIDLLVSEDDKTFFTEINLNGGIKGADITTLELKKKKREREEELLEQMLMSSST